MRFFVLALAATLAIVFLIILAFAEQLQPQHCSPFSIGKAMLLIGACGHTH